MLMSIPSFSMGFIAGFGTGFLSRELVSTGAAVLRPVTKIAVKSSMIVFEKSRETLAHFSETLEDLVAEAKSEVAQPTAAQQTADESLAAATVDVQETHAASETTKGKDRHRAHGKKEHG